MYYLEPLALSTSTTSPKIHGIQQLLTLGIPTIKLPFITTKELFREYYQNRKICDKAWSEFGHVFATIATNSTITLRHNAYESSNLELTFVAPNTLNIGSFDSFRRILESNCKLLASKVINPSKADVRFIFQSYYKSIKCGSLNHDGNAIEIKAILGEHTRALQVEGITPDVYRAPASLTPFKLTQLGEHSRIFKVTRHGLKTIENRIISLKEPILDHLQLKKLASWSRLIFKHYGSHSLFFAELTTGELIIQDLLTKKEAV
ncbi:MAG: hypothetical protein V1487_04075 [bacterium]